MLTIFLSLRAFRVEATAPKSGRVCTGAFTYIMSIALPQWKFPQVNKNLKIAYIMELLIGKLIQDDQIHDYIRI